MAEITKAKTASHKEWLALRGRFIGGSDTAAVVVRCKDCKWFFQDADNEPCCMNVCGLVIVTDEDFCSYGERRGDDVAD